jgi:hypothetical protein
VEDLTLARVNPEVKDDIEAGEGEHTVSLIAFHTTRAERKVENTNTSSLGLDEIPIASHLVGETRIRRKK